MTGTMKKVVNEPLSTGLPPGQSTVIVYGVPPAPPGTFPTTNEPNTVPRPRKRLTEAEACVTKPAILPVIEHEVPGGEMVGGPANESTVTTSPGAAKTAPGTPFKSRMRGLTA
jgi:hypothetical protein